ncbi:hypothetical protein C3Y87_02880 [Carbonactinospora thermoautotrophica]|nr:hypothetical protein [Carbonactinospora thermoautotrophica]
MDKLRRLPVIGRIWRAYAWYRDGGGDRMAGAVTYFGFLSLFPLLALAVAVVAATLGPDEVNRVEELLKRQIPGVAEEIPLTPIIQGAGTLGLVGAVGLLYSGLGWVDAARSTLRTMWRLEEEPGNFVVRKLADTGVLIGLGLIAAFSVVASTLATTLTRVVVEQLGIADTFFGRYGLRLFALAIAVGVDFVLFVYLLVGLPRISMPWRAAAQGALLGAVVFELLKYAVAAYIDGVAGRSWYGAFGVPVALLLWFNLTARLLLFCAAWTATDRAAERETERRGAEEREAAARTPGVSTTSRAQLAAGAALGVLASLAVLATARGVRGLRYRALRAAAQGFCETRVSNRYRTAAPPKNTPAPSRTPSQPSARSPRDWATTPGPPARRSPLPSPDTRPGLGSGSTSWPTGWTLPEAANPQSSSRPASS